jgi:hypothetical protein
VNEVAGLAEKVTGSSYTPGPWYVEAVMGDDPHEICIDSREGRGTPEVIASVVWDDEDPHPVLGLAEANANARLIAAAPDLLQALKAVVAISDRKHDAWDAAHAVIAKAEGRS